MKLNINGTTLKYMVAVTEAVTEKKIDIIDKKQRDTEYFGSDGKIKTSKR